ncbi:hypothetical protein OMW55_01635 [Sphingomonas sp. BN140010]|uniref:Uncharacterized protein n=1 Tax=Sphingomonas arvum TaxID=2992113 RepID=A0ABT3JBT7_9SPHN|nr:hypothetical protein [Sphingomonas sp. BN140010]MCW3796512.1 hypothetical protein [Sphingomonas sp. BN140010]
MLTFKESWNYSASTKRKFEVLVNDKNLSHADAQSVTEEIAASGPFQADFAVCTNTGFELILLRYTPSASQMHLGFSGRALNRVSVSDASTGFKLIDRSPTK